MDFRPSSTHCPEPISYNKSLCNHATWLRVKLCQFRFFLLLLPWGSEYKQKSQHRGVGAPAWYTWCTSVTNGEYRFWPFGPQRPTQNTWSHSGGENKELTLNTCSVLNGESLPLHSPFILLQPPSKLPNSEHQHWQPFLHFWKHCNRLSEQPYSLLCFSLGLFSFWSICFPHLPHIVQALKHFTPKMNKTDIDWDPSICGLDHKALRHLHVCNKTF